ncbi:hypothetical protein [Clostridium niameyense]|nr:hypothetical protein [Clostridium niameyense]
MKNLDNKALINKDEQAMDRAGYYPESTNDDCGNIRIRCNTVNIYVNCNS